MNTPIHMGRKGTPPNWTAFNKRAKAKIGRIPLRDEKLSAEEWHRMGFTEAGKELRGRTFQ